MAKFGKNIILHNRYLLYFIFIVALSDFLYLVYINDIYSASIFALIGFLTSFFSKNMIVILVMAMAVSNILKFGNRSAVKEGFTDDDVAEDENAEDEKAEEEETEEEEASKENKGEPENKKEKGDKKNKSEKPVKEKKESPLSVETTEDSDKETFGQDKNVVYTADKDKSVDNVDKTILAQEQILERMNKYKPLLDTINGISKNMAIMKGASNIVNDK
jgi:FtsZ-interacting cell division protein ZipA